MRRELGSIPACAGEPPPRRWRRTRTRVYPRVCGGTPSGSPTAKEYGGLSPRVRGNLRGLPLPCPGRGSIPACAGEPSQADYTVARVGVYPRVCGGTIADQGIAPYRLGLSPRVRGNPRSPPDSASTHGSIPACAGEPPPTFRCRPAWRVYPRVCGGTLTIVRRSLRAGGPIPACAGEPYSALPTHRPGRVYPRVCGGTWVMRRSKMACTGLSPRVRGNRREGARTVARRGSIPACAGEPPSSSCPTLSPRVYPRVCGGTPLKALAAPAGLSPRVRGNRRCADAHHAIAGSIPACAGEPRPDRPPRRSTGVYPRVCGGTSSCERREKRREGLSPRVRGNRRASAARACGKGSIPACAGEPPGRLGGRRLPRVYPRVCGGTSEPQPHNPRDRGLSPRVRGNPTARTARPRLRGSIPACAGEP